MRQKYLKPIFENFTPVGKVKREEDEFYEQDWNQDVPISRLTIGVYVFRFICLAIVVIFAYKLSTLQIAQGNQNYSLAQGNSLRMQYTLAPRGLIYDKNGVALVSNTPSYALTIYPKELPTDKTARSNIFQIVADILGKKVDDFNSQVATGLKSQQAITLLDGIDRNTAMSIELKTNNLPGVEVTVQPTRQYNYSSGLGHLLGYVGKPSQDDLNNDSELLSNALIGKSGVELTYDKYLRGTIGIDTLEVDSGGRVIRQIGSQNAKIGSSVYLSIDSNVEKIAAESLQKAMTATKATSGAAIMTDVNTGGIIASVSLPDYNDNNMLPTASDADRLALINDTTSPMLDRAISGRYPSGSSIKPTVAAAALQEKVITGDTKLDTSEGKITIGQWSFPDWKTHGVTSVRQAIAESNNIFFFSLGGGYKNISGLGVDRLLKYYKLFGFSETSGIDLSGESKGFLPSPDWKKTSKKENWYIGDTYNISIGQGDLLVTPLQLNLSTVAIANGGKLLTPHIVKSIVDPVTGKTEDIATKIRRENFIDSGNIRIVQEGMRLAVTAGSARSFNNLAVQVAAKTGTAQFANQDISKTHSWFTAYAPYDNPQVAVTVIVENGGEGYAVAAPVAKNMIEQYFNLPISPIFIEAQ